MIAGRLGARPAALALGIPLVALTAAVVEELIASVPAGWSWLDFGQSTVRNGCFAIVVVGCVALANLRRVPTAAKPSPEQLVRELAEVTRVADDLGLTCEPAEANDQWDTPFEYLDSVRWSLADYVLRGDRTRKLMNSNGAIGTAAANLSQRVRHTNTVIAEWLVAHRVAPVNPSYLDSNALYDRYRHGRLDPDAVAEDPLYLLTCHLHDVLDAVERTGAVDDPALAHLGAKLTLPLRAVQEEVAEALVFHAAAYHAATDQATHIGQHRRFRRYA